MPRAGRLVDAMSVQIGMPVWCHVQGDLWTPCRFKLECQFDATCGETCGRHVGSNWNASLVPRAGRPVDAMSLQIGMQVWCHVQGDLWTPCRFKLECQFGATCGETCGRHVASNWNASLVPRAGRLVDAMSLQIGMPVWCHVQGDLWTPCRFKLECQFGAACGETCGRHVASNWNASLVPRAGRLVDAMSVQIGMPVWCHVQGDLWTPCRFKLECQFDATCGETCGRHVGSNWNASLVPRAGRPVDAMSLQIGMPVWCHVRGDLWTPCRFKLECQFGATCGETCGRHVASNWNASLVPRAGRPVDAMSLQIGMPVWCHVRGDLWTPCRFKLECQFGATCGETCGRHVASNWNASLVPRAGRPVDAMSLQIGMPVWCRVRGDLWTPCRFKLECQFGAACGETCGRHVASNWNASLVPRAGRPVDAMSLQIGMPVWCRVRGDLWTPCRFKLECQFGAACGETCGRHVASNWNASLVPRAGRPVDAMSLQIGMPVWCHVRGDLWTPCRFKLECQFGAACGETCGRHVASNWNASLVPRAGRLVDAMSLQIGMQVWCHVIGVCSPQSVDTLSASTFAMMESSSAPLSLTN